MTDKLTMEFETEFHEAWDIYRCASKPFRSRNDFSSTRRVNIIEISNGNATIGELNENGETVVSVVPLSMLKDFRK